MTPCSALHLPPAQVGCTPLHFAAREGHREMVQLLLEAGARTGPSNTVGSTPLHWAADAGHTDVVGLLCDAGANTEATTQASASTRSPGTTTPLPPFPCCSIPSHILIDDEHRSLPCYRSPNLLSNEAVGDAASLDFRSGAPLYT